MNVRPGQYCNLIYDARVKRAAIYARLSRDRNGSQTATSRQVADCRKFAEAKGWEVVAVHEDADLSAYSAKVVRPGFEALKASVEAGDADVVLAWKLDRLLRRPREFEVLWQLCEAAGANVVTVSDGIDTAQPMAGLLVPRIMSNFAELEAENLSLRERRKHEETAKAGKRSGGGHRPFGLSRDWSTVVPDEADLIRDAVGRIISGQSMYGIAAEWNRKGIVTPTGRTWSVQLLKSMLRSPRLAGLREHRGAIVGPGQWPAIVDPNKHEQLRAILSRKSRPGQPGRFLLSGRVRCAVCGNTMFIRRRHRDKARFYGCEKVAGGTGCGHVHIVAEPLEALVRDAVLERLDSPQMMAAINAHNRQTVEAADLDALHADEEALQQLARDYYSDRVIGRSEYLAVRDELEGRIEATRRQVAKVNGMGKLGELAGFGAKLRAAWDGQTPEWRREIVATVIDRVQVSPGRRGPNRFDPSRVSIEWRY